MRELPVFNCGRSEDMFILCFFCLNVTAVRTSVDVFLILSAAQLLGAQKSLGIASHSGTIDVPDST
jgi:hypothetical protein